MTEKVSLGFQLKGTAKRQKIINDNNESQPFVDIIKSISDGTTVSVAPKPAKSLLVIPLLTNSNVPKETKTSTAVTEDLAIQAERELLAELSGVNNIGDSGLVIHQDNSSNLVKKKGPMLLNSVDPSAAHLNDDDKFKLDMKNRADDISFKSDVYEKIPVGEYGAALLRGMGWKGNIDDAKPENNIVPRDARLGLGAVAKPPETKYGNNGNRGEKDNKHAAYDRNLEEKRRNQILQINDLVWITNVKYAGKRAKVIQTKMPGLDKIKIQLELDGSVMDIGKKEVVLLTDKELSDKPFAPVAMEVPGNHSTKFFGLVGDSDNESKDKTHKSKKRKGKHQRDDSRDRHHKDNNKERKSTELVNDNADKNSDRLRESHKSSESVSTNSTKSKVADWLRPGIRVKIVSKSICNGKFYGMKGVVIDVPARSEGSVRLDNGSVVDNIKESRLETILPVIGKQCIILVGEFKGQTATLLETQYENEMAVVELIDDMCQVVISMNHIAAFS